MNDDTSIKYLGMKFFSALAVVATMDFWTNLGKLAAAAYSIALLGEWLWKKWVKPRWFPSDQPGE